MSPVGSDGHLTILSLHRADNPNSVQFGFDANFLNPFHQLSKMDVQILDNSQKQFKHVTNKEIPG